MTELEVLARPLRRHDEIEQDRVGARLGGGMLDVLPLTREIASLAAGVRAETRLDVADAVIVATALYAGCDAIVGNDARVAQRVDAIPYFLLDDLVKERPS